MARDFTVNTNYLQTSSGWLPVTGSISFWFKPAWSSGDSTDHILATCEVTDFFRIEKFSDNNCYIGWDIGGVDDRVVFADTGIFTSGVWTLVVVTWVSAGNTTAYIGSATARGTHVTPTNPSVAASMSIGARANITSANGTIADFAAWNVALTAAEVGALLSGVRPNRIRPQPLRFWPIDGLSSPEPDYSGNKDNAVLNGTPPAANGPPVTLLTAKGSTAPLIGVAGGFTPKARRTLCARVGSRQAA